MFDTMNSPNRNLAIDRAVRDQGGTPTNVAKRFGISRQRVHQILNAYDAGGAEAIAPKSRAPHTHDYQQAYWKHGDPRVKGQKVCPESRIFRD